MIYCVEVAVPKFNGEIIKWIETVPYCVEVQEIGYYV